MPLLSADSQRGGDGGLSFLRSSLAFKVAGGNRLIKFTAGECLIKHGVAGVSLSGEATSH
jgi:hypothetical protein